MLPITEPGVEVLKKKPEKIDNNLLKQFPEFMEFQNIRKEGSESLTQIESTQVEKQSL